MKDGQRCLCVCVVYVYMYVTHLEARRRLQVLCFIVTLFCTSLRQIHSGNQQVIPFLPISPKLDLEVEEWTLLGFIWVLGISRFSCLCCMLSLLTELSPEPLVEFSQTFTYLSVCLLFLCLCLCSCMPEMNVRFLLLPSPFLRQCFLLNLEFILWV